MNILKKSLAGVLAGALTLAPIALTGCGNAVSTLSILTWEEYIPHEVVDDFAKETGIKVNYATFDTNEEMYSKIQAQKNSYDIVVGSDYIIDLMRRDGLLMELDRSKLPNFANLNPSYMNQYYDPGNRFSVPYTEASGIIVYDSAKVDFPVTGYADLWNPAFKNKVVLIDGDRDIIGLTLQMLGYSVNDTDPAHLAEAESKLMELKPNIVKLDSNVPYESMISGDAIIGYMFGSQATAAKDDIPTMEFVYPAEGMTFCIDNLFIPAGAPHAYNAYQFLNYIMDGNVAAKTAELINYATANNAAQPYLSQKFRDNASFNIPSDVLGKAEMFVDLGDAKVLYDDIWTRFKSR